MKNVCVKTKIYSEENALSILGQFKQKRILIICDAFLVESGNIHFVCDELDSSNQVEIFSGVVPDPTIEVVGKGLSKASQFKPDIIIGFGGGSAIDTAKLILYFGETECLFKKEYFIAIPTTSGTGSEVTNVAVVTDTENQTKKVIDDESILADIALLDARLVLSVPPKITANTGMDVLTHALESYVAKESSYFSDALAEKAVELVIEALLKCYIDGKDKVARGKMHEASTLAGLAFNAAGLGINHSMAHQLGGTFHIPHGLANAILLKTTIAFNSEEPWVKEKYATLAKHLGLVEGEKSSDYALKTLLQLIESLMTYMHMPKCVSDLGVDKHAYEKALSHMAECATIDRCTPGNPRSIYVEVIKNLMAKVY